MAFVALREIHLNGRDGGKITISPGEVVPGFDRWGIPQQRALLNMHYVKEVHGEIEPEPEAQASVAEEAPAKCPHCPNKTFASKRGLAIHIGQQHR